METMPQIVGGVDTHSDAHVAAALSTGGHIIAIRSFSTDQVGYWNMHEWFASAGDLVAVGVEGTGAYGKGLTRFLQARNVNVIEVGRVNRQQRRRHGKTDTKDAVAAARAVISGEACAAPRDTGGPVEALRVMRVARNSAVKSRAATTNRIRAIIVTAPEPVRSQLRDLTISKIVGTVCRYRPDVDNVADPVSATKLALKSLGTQYHALTEQIGHLTRAIERVVDQIAPTELTTQTGIGPITAADLLITYGTNPDRIASDKGFAAL